MKRVGVGIIGCGTIAKTSHIPSYLRTPECELIALADQDLGTAKELAHEHAIERVYDDYRELLECDEIDAVSVCTPPSTHSEIVIGACEAGKHILCEKPIALSLEEADQMINAAQRAGVILAIGHQFRFLPNVQKAREMVDKKAIGEVLTCYGEFSSGGPFFGDWKTSSDYYLKIGSGAAVLFNYGTHIFDLFNFFFGKAEKVSAMVKRGQVKTIAIENKAIAVVEYESGILAAMNTFYTRSRHPDRVFVNLYGLEGKISVSLPRPTLTLYKTNTIISRLHGARKLVFRSKDPFLLEINDFIRSITSHKKPLVTDVDGRNALELALAANRSYELQQTIDLPLN